ncbi:amino acid ABC transporter permease [Paraburkholderia sp. SOS3]|jgi:polar amino acid transport system permease protein|uniref:amino acid ABC transporter permease n=1 Tax=Paraburkholderia sp. SOS3 TaxID=1926494 RepID=UPI0009474F83|nr:amino acid ABC transporter permease [Paraburkholderia sp. SOS3]APR38778.1 amino acid ABC transporter [Paraburkholderia sp. SOS3]
MPGTGDGLVATVAPFVRDFAAGAATTIVASVIAFAIGIVIGCVLLLLRQHGGRFFAACVIVYVSVIRGTPALIQMLIAYYVLPAVLNISIAPLPAGILALALNTAAYVSEILRGALNTLGRGQVPAGRALGMNTLQVWRYIVLPQLFYRSIPPLTSEFTMLLKASSLMSIIAVHDLATVARDATLQTNLPLQLFSLTAALYFAILFVASSASRRIERRFAKVLPHGH